MKIIDIFRVLIFDGWATKTKSDTPIDIATNNPTPSNIVTDVPAPDFSPIISLDSDLKEPITPVDTPPKIPDIGPSCEVINTEGNIKEDIIAKNLSVSSALLDNGAYMSMASKLSDLYKEIEQISNSSTSDEVHDVVGIVEDRIIEGLVASGAAPIANEQIFNISRHETVPKSIVRKGAPIAETLKPGIVIGGRVLIKAKVVVEK